jgi:hypothetical protein
MNKRSRLATLVVTGAMATTIGAGLAVPAQAAPNVAAGRTVAPTTSQVAAERTATSAVAESAHMTIRSLGSGNYSVTVSGRFNLKQPVPAGYSIKLIGEDPWFDDTPVCDEWPLTTNASGGFWHQFTCPGSLLNEDLEGQDENYAKVTVFESGKSHSVRSNTVKGSY